MRRCAVVKKTLAWWCVFGVVAVADRIWRSSSQSYIRPLAQRLGVTPRDGRVGWSECRRTLVANIPLHARPTVSWNITTSRSVSAPCVTPPRPMRRGPMSSWRKSVPNRLQQLAVTASDHAALSPKLEIYPRGLAAALSHERAMRDRFPSRDSFLRERSNR